MLTGPKLLNAPPENILKGVRDLAILAALFYYGLRCEELWWLRLRDLQSRQEVMHFPVRGKRGKIRIIPKLLYLREKEAGCFTPPKAGRPQGLVISR